PFTVHRLPFTLFMPTPLLIFAATYFLIAVQRVRWLHLNRPAAALLGAVAMVTVGGLSLDDAYRAIDLDVLVFLLGLMLLVGHLELGGFFEWAADWLLLRSTTPRRFTGRRGARERSSFG